MLYRLKWRRVLWYKSKNDLNGADLILSIFINLFCFFGVSFSIVGYYCYFCSYNIFRWNTMTISRNSIFSPLRVAYCPTPSTRLLRYLLWSHVSVTQINFRIFQLCFLAFRYSRMRIARRWFKPLLLFTLSLYIFVWTFITQSFYTISFHRMDGIYRCIFCRYWFKARRIHNRCLLLLTDQSVVNCSFPSTLFFLVHNTICNQCLILFN